MKSFATELIGVERGELVEGEFLVGHCAISAHSFKDDKICDWLPLRIKTDHTPFDSSKIFDYLFVGESGAIALWGAIPSGKKVATSLISVEAKGRSSTV